MLNKNESTKIYHYYKLHKYFKNCNDYWQHIYSQHVFVLTSLEHDVFVFTTVYHAYGRSSFTVLNSV